ncbi:hypothetical protein [Caproicibacter sp. BJN0012]|uniref:hypothetical protein n=1 Tax=Caproicibacter sp. BJN0012 TaxID=3110227 RepID=UPI002E0EDF90
MTIAEIEKDTQAYLLLSLVAVSGELPASQVHRLIGSESYGEKLLTSLRDRRLLRTCYKDKLRGHRLTAKAKALLLADNHSRFSFFLTGNINTNLIKSEVPRRLRLHRISEATVTMQNAGVSIFRDEKPDVFYPEGANPVQLPAIKQAAYYNSREIKEFGEESEKVRGARTVGVLLTPRDVYVIYNTADTLMKWEYKVEMRIKALMKHVLCYQRLPHQYRSESIKGLVLGESMETAYQLLTSTGGVKHSYFVLDGNYDSVLFLTNDHAGEVLLRLLCDPEKTNELNRMLMGGLYPPNPAMLFENDAIDEHGNPVLFAYFCDMPRITRFSTALNLREKTGSLICFDYQKEALQRFCGDRVNIQTIDLKKFKRRFYHED